MHPTASTSPSVGKGARSFEHAGALERGLDELARTLLRVATGLIDVPIAILSVSRPGGMAFLACHGIDRAKAADLEDFLDHARATRDGYIIENAAADPKFSNHSSVRADPNLRFHAGIQLRAHCRTTIGALCVFGPMRAKMDGKTLQALEDLGHCVAAQLDVSLRAASLERALTRQRRRVAGFKRSNRRFQGFLDANDDILWETDSKLRIVSVCDPQMREIRAGSLRGLTLVEAAQAYTYTRATTSFRDDLIACRHFRQRELKVRTPWGTHLWIEVSGAPAFNRGRFAGYRGTLRNITERKLAEERVRQLAEEDPLTRLPNRRRFDAVLNETLAARSSSCLLLLDIDRFKQVNDRYGHRAGDRLVEAVGQRIAAQIRTEDLIARIGGDEFAAILRKAEPQQAAAIADRILRAMSEPLDIDGSAIAATVSIGGVMIPDTANDAETALKNADLALYRAKRAGRNQFCLFDDVWCNG